MKTISTPAIVLFLLVGVVSFSFFGQETPPEEACPLEVTAWLVENATPFDTTDPTAPLDDLEPLRAIIGDARIVGLGEQTHGTKEFSEMKHRIFQFLVEEMGFRLLGFEADWFGLMELNACLLPDGPPIETAFENLAYWPWLTDEVMDLLRWMRAFNEANPLDRPVQLVGLDATPDTPEFAVLKADEYLQQFVPDSSAEMRTALGREFPNCYSYIRAVYLSSADFRDPPRVKACAAVLEPVIDWMKENRDACVDASSSAEYLMTLHALELASKELVHMTTSDLMASYSLRDSWLADNVPWWLAFLGESKMVIWAHNAHIARGLTDGDPWIRMGEFLDEVYSDEYLPIGFSFAEGSFAAWGRRGLQGMTGESLIPGCYEAAFQTTGLPRFVLDLRNIEPESDISEWMHVERDFRLIGSLYGPLDLGWDYPTVLPKSFDIIIHIETSTAAQQRAG